MMSWSALLWAWSLRCDLQKCRERLIDERSIAPISGAVEEKSANWGVPYKQWKQQKMQFVRQKQTSLSAVRKTKTNSTNAVRKTKTEMYWCSSKDKNEIIWASMHRHKTLEISFSKVDSEEPSKHCIAVGISRRLAGYWEKFSISNHHVSVELHRLW